MKVLLVDDHTLFRNGLRLVLQQLDKTIEVDEAGSCESAMQQAGAPYELILLDWYMPGLTGIESLGRMRECFPSTPVVIVSGEHDSAVVRSAIDNGAMGYIPKSESPEVLVHALRLVVVAHGVYLPNLLLVESSPRAPALEAHAPADPAVHNLKVLTQRQMEVLMCVIRGKPNKVIARELEIAEGTVRAHVGDVLRALNARNRTEAVYEAARLGLTIV